MGILKSLGVALVRAGYAVLTAIETEKEPDEAADEAAPDSDVNAAYWMGYTGPSARVTSAGSELLAQPQQFPPAKRTPLPEKPLAGSLQAQRQAAMKGNEG